MLKIENKRNYEIKLNSSLGSQIFKRRMVEVLSVESAQNVINVLNVIKHNGKINFTYLYYNCNNLQRVDIIDHTVKNYLDNSIELNKF